MAPSPSPMSTAIVTLATIVFGTDVTEVGSDVDIGGVTNAVASGDEIAWRVVLPTADGKTSVRVTVTTSEGGDAVVDETFIPAVGSNVYYGKTVLATDVGDYILSYYYGGRLVGQGSFSITSAPTPEPTTKATPKPTPKPSPKPTHSANCDPAYPDFCIPPSPPDLDCGDIDANNFTVLPPDPHRFDGDHDGIGCES